MGSMLVRHEPASASLIRRELADDLDRYGVGPHAADEAILVASELIGNAIRHSPVDGAGLLVDWDIDGETVFIRVTDHGGQLPTPRAAGEHDTTGRGLAIVSALASRWGVDPVHNGTGGPDGKCVWAQVPLHRTLV